MATSASSTLKYVETVLSDVLAVLMKMHEDKEGVSLEYRSKLSGCLDELTHALLAVQGDELGLRGKVERLEAIEALVDPPRTKQWTRYRGTLLQCIEQASDLYHYHYSDQEGQGDHDWRVKALSLKQGDQEGGFTWEVLGPRIEVSDIRDMPAVLDHDTRWFGETIYDEHDKPLWVFAKIYRLPDPHPAAYIYRIDFEPESE